MVYSTHLTNVFDVANQSIVNSVPSLIELAIVMPVHVSVDVEVFANDRTDDVRAAVDGEIGGWRIKNSGKSRAGTATRIQIDCLLNAGIGGTDAVDLKISCETAVVYAVRSLGAEISGEVKLEVNVVRDGDACALARTAADIAVHFHCDVSFLGRAVIRKRVHAQVTIGRV